MRDLDAAAARDFASSRARHLADYQPLFRRVALDLGASVAAARPTDARVRAFTGANDPQLPALYFQFGRYLLLSSSRPGTHTTVQAAVAAAPENATKPFRILIKPGTFQGQILIPKTKPFILKRKMGESTDQQAGKSNHIAQKETKLTKSFL